MVQQYSPYYSCPALHCDWFWLHIRPPLSDRIKCGILNRKIPALVSGEDLQKYCYYN